ncbi:hypothetical protein [Escherichia phage ECML-117]|uniref:Uncharacterized protein n=1 Tax=Escherichia phage ECML-117 TaxID=1204521 RepID=I7A8J1_9CAUD|nr:hypothetical protein PI34_gp18 [Escherichia phage ECML-117]AFO10451.1 hypothetical protein [Escherichia phage ECML-117]
MITLAAIRSARVETSENSNVFGETLESVYLSNVDATIESIYEPINFLDLYKYRDEDIVSYRVTINGFVYTITEIGGEYIAVPQLGGEVTYFKIVSL